MEKYDLIIVGAGPAGIFTAVELLRHGSKKIPAFEKIFVLGAVPLVKADSSAASQ